jgi:hypothetical protein
VAEGLEMGTPSARLPVTDPGGVPPGAFSLGLAPSRRQHPTLHPQSICFVFLGKGDGWEVLLTSVLKDGS